MVFKDGLFDDLEIFKDKIIRINGCEIMSVITSLSTGRTSIRECQLKRDLQLLGFKRLSEKFVKSKIFINPIHFHVNIEHSSCI